KQDIATEVFERLVASGRAALSVQCLSEFFSTSTRLLGEPLSRGQALERVERFARVCNILELTGQAVLLGCQATIRHQMSIWDALIWAVARTNQVPFIITEDAEHGRELEGVRYLNPFDGAFDLDALGV